MDVISLCGYLPKYTQSQVTFCPASIEESFTILGLLIFSAAFTFGSVIGISAKLTPCGQNPASIAMDKIKAVMRDKLMCFRCFFIDFPHFLLERI